MRTSVFIATSIDGYIAREDGSLDWLVDTSGEESGEDYGYAAFMDTIDTVLLGRNTFDVVAGMDQWPYTGKRVVVCSNTTTVVDYPERIRGLFTIVAGSADEAWDVVCSEGAQHVYADGGRLIQALLRSGRINDVTITRIPIILGQGIPLFANTQRDILCEHVSTKDYNSGFVQSTYRLKYLQ